MAERRQIRVEQVYQFRFGRNREHESDLVDNLGPPILPETNPFHPRFQVVGEGRNCRWVLSGSQFRVRRLPGANP